MHTDDRAGVIDPDADLDQRRSRSRVRYDVLAVIALGGVVGASGRYAIADLVPTGTDGFPTATFLTNVAGSFLLGLVAVLAVERLPPGRYLRPFVATGVLGAFTTFSTFAVESVVLVDHGRPTLAVVYVVSTVVVGLAAAWCGVAAARVLAARPSRPAP
jgi:CrcB protein